MHRLIVLLPNQVIDGDDLAQRSGALASPSNREVLFLDLHRRDDGETDVRQATLTSIRRDEWTILQTRVENDQDWIRAVRSVWRAGDMIVCDTSHHVVTAKGKRVQLGIVLTSSLDVPVCMLTGLCPQRPMRHPKSLARMAYNMIPLLIIAGSLVVQVTITRAATGGMRSALMLLVFVITIGLIWKWNQFMA